MQGRGLSFRPTSPFTRRPRIPFTEKTPIAEGVARAAVAVSKEAHAKLLVAFTASGSTARFVSKARPRPIAAFSPNEATEQARSTGALSPLHRTAAGRRQHGERASTSPPKLGSPGDKIVAVFGAPAGVAGGTNSIRVRVLE
jgi:pyruvate kinase